MRPKNVKPVEEKEVSTSSPQSCVPHFSLLKPPKCSLACVTGLRGSGCQQYVLQRRATQTDLRGKSKKQAINRGWRQTIGCFFKKIKNNN